MKKHYLLFTALLVLCLGACTNETADVLDEVVKPIALDQKHQKIKLYDDVNVDLSATTDIIAAFSKNGRANSWSSTGKDEAEFWLEPETALMVMDSIGNKTYSTIIRSSNPDPKQMINLITTERVDDDFQDPFVLVYTFSEGDINDYRQMTEKKFKGSIEVHTLTDFIASTGLSGKSDPCKELENDNNNASSSGGGGSSGAGSGGPGASSSGGRRPSYSSSTTVYRVKRTGAVEVGEGEFGRFGSDNMQKSLVAKNLPCPKGEIVLPINETMKEERPSCESFEYTKLGNTGRQWAAVNGIWDVVTKWGKCPGIGVAASYQTYYFSLPSHYSPTKAARLSADALESAFYDMQTWFRKQKCKQIMTGVLAQKMDEYIKEAFSEINGRALRSAPLGWNGKPTKYKEDWTGSDTCN
jgi:hypothetical protein